MSIEHLGIRRMAAQKTIVVDFSRELPVRTSYSLGTPVSRT